MALFYKYEKAELDARNNAIKVRGLELKYPGSFEATLHNITLLDYISLSIYFIATLFIVLVDCCSWICRLKTVIFNSFKDLNALNISDVFSSAASISIWPLTRNSDVKCSCPCCLLSVFLPIVDSHILGIHTYNLSPWADDLSHSEDDF